MAKKKNDDEKKDVFYKKVGKNIRSYREMKKLSLDDVARLTGTTKKTIQRYEVGESRFTMGTLHDIAKALSVKTSALMEGMESYLGLEPINKEIKSIPILGFVPAGGPVVVEESLEGYIPLPKMLTKGEWDFCLKVRGDSMEDVGINDGDMVMIHPQPVAENGQTVIARVNGEVTCKRFYRTNDTCRLEPANINYKPINCDDIEIVGIVTHVIKEIF